MTERKSKAYIECVISAISSVFSVCVVSAVGDGNCSPWVTCNSSVVQESMGASQYPSSSPRSSILLPMTRKPIELSHIEGHLNSLIAPGGVEGRGGRRLPEES